MKGGTSGIGGGRGEVQWLHDEAISMSSLVGPLRVESSIAVEDAVENRGLYRAFVSRWF